MTTAAATVTRLPGADHPDLLVDHVHRIVSHRGTEVLLTAREFEILSILATDPLRVFTRDELYRHLWGTPHTPRSRSIDAHCHRLKAKLGREFLHNVWGVGYRLALPAQNARVLCVGRRPDATGERKPVSRRDAALDFAHLARELARNNRQTAQLLERFAALVERPT